MLKVRSLANLPTVGSNISMKSTLSIIVIIFPTIIFGQLKFNNLSTKVFDNKELFVGVENYIEITGIDYKASKTVFNISHGELSKVSGNKYLIRVNSTKPDTLKFYQDNRLSLIEVFSVKTIPFPIARLAGNSDTLLSVSQIKINPFLSVILPSCNFRHYFQIISFDTKIINANGDTTSIFGRTNGNFLPKELLFAIEKLNPKDKLLFEAINATCPDCRNIRLPSLLISIK